MNNITKALPFLIVKDPLVDIPIICLYTASGAIASTWMYEKTSDAATYAFNKLGADYKNPMKLDDGKIIVTMPTYNRYRPFQNLLITSILTLTAYKIFEFLASRVNSPWVIFSLATSTMITPIVLGILNICNSHKLQKHFYVVLNQVEIEKNHIDKEKVKKITQAEWIYEYFGGKANLKK